MEKIVRLLLGIMEYFLVVQILMEKPVLHVRLKIQMKISLTKIKMTMMVLKVPTTKPKPWVVRKYVFFRSVWLLHTREMFFCPTVTTGWLVLIFWILSLIQIAIIGYAIGGIVVFALCVCFSDRDCWSGEKSTEMERAQVWFVD